MLEIFERIRMELQFFAEGAAAGDGGDAGSGPSDSGMDTLESLGVPRDKVEKYRALKGRTVQNTDVVATEQLSAAAETDADADDAAWEEAKKNPAINKRMQETVNARLKDFAKKNGDAQSKLDKLTPVLELVGRKAGIDVSDINNLDLDSFVAAVNNDDSYYDDIAADMGVDTETARRIDMRERETARQERETARQQQDMQLRQHFDGLVRQGEELKKVIPGFDLQRELEDPWFARVTAPGGGLTVKQAFDAKYHDQMMQAARDNTVRYASQAISNSIRSGRSMPIENGTVARQASPTSMKPYSQMNPEEKAAYYKALTGQTKRSGR